MVGNKEGTIKVIYRKCNNRQKKGIYMEVNFLAINLLSKNCFVGDYVVTQHYNPFGEKKGQYLRGGVDW